MYQRDYNMHRSIRDEIPPHLMRLLLVVQSCVVDYYSSLNSLNHQKVHAGIAIGSITRQSSIFHRSNNFTGTTCVACGNRKTVFEYKWSTSYTTSSWHTYDLNQNQSYKSTLIYNYQRNITGPNHFIKNCIQCGDVYAGSI